MDHVAPMATTVADAAAHARRARPRVGRAPGVGRAPASTAGLRVGTVDAAFAERRARRRRCGDAPRSTRSAAAGCRSSRARPPRPRRPRRRQRRRPGRQPVRGRGAPPRPRPRPRPLLGGGGRPARRRPRPSPRSTTSTPSALRARPREDLLAAFADHRRARHADRARGRAAGRRLRPPTSCCWPATPSRGASSASRPISVPCGTVDGPAGRAAARRPARPRGPARRRRPLVEQLPPATA